MNNECSFKSKRIKLEAMRNQLVVEMFFFKYFTFVMCGYYNIICSAVMRSVATLFFINFYVKILLD